MRDKRQTADHFNECVSFWVEKNKSNLEELKSNMGISDGNRPMAAYILFGDSIRYIKCLYSRGDNLATFMSAIRFAIDMLEAVHIEIKARPLNEQKTLKQYLNFDLDDYIDYLLLLSFAVNLGFQNSEITHLINLIDHAGKDALFDRMAHKFTPDRIIGADLFHPKPYQPLFDALNATPEKQVKLIKTFLDKWYPSLKRVGWWGGFEKNSDAYCGYWCFEAALVVRVFNIDDSSFADHPYYPKDLAAYDR